MSSLPSSSSSGYVVAAAPESVARVALGSMPCTICWEVPERHGACIVPVCGHHFCVDCLLSWAAVKRCCPNCKERFDALLVHRDPASGDICGDERVVDVDTLQHCKWVTLHELEPIVEDIAAAFNYVRVSPEERRREAQRSSEATGVPNYACEELEDAAEERFWANELSSYDAYDEDSYFRLARRSRLMGNRRYGVNGYMSSGHMVARASRNEAASQSSIPKHPQGVQRNVCMQQSDNTATSGACERVEVPVTRRHKPPSSGGKRNKKVKKKSRSAAEAATAAAVASVATSGTFPSETDRVAREYEETVPNDSSEISAFGCSLCAQVESVRLSPSEEGFHEQQCLDSDPGPVT